jgi:hypothetical protein
MSDSKTPWQRVGRGGKPEAPIPTSNVYSHLYNRDDFPAMPKSKLPVHPQRSGMTLLKPSLPSARGSSSDTELMRAVQDRLSQHTEGPQGADLAEVVMGFIHHLTCSATVEEDMFHKSFRGMLEDLNLQWTSPDIIFNIGCIMSYCMALDNIRLSIESSPRPNGQKVTIEDVILRINHFMADHGRRARDEATEMTTRPKSFVGKLVSNPFRKIREEPKPEKKPKTAKKQVTKKATETEPETPADTPEAPADTPEAPSAQIQ